MAGPGPRTRTPLALLATLLIAATVPSTAIATPEPPPPGTPPSLTGLERSNKIFLPRYLRRGTGSQLPNRTTFSFFMNQKANVQIVFKRVLA
ncbi:MAG TPA: hypothetical protein VD741_01635, partial [Solirubrobacterales bacterium]|nr:hypothetical protein [Solirubrobacterales bacterium]